MARVGFTLALLLAAACFSCRTVDEPRDASADTAGAGAPERPVPDAGAAELTSLGALLQPLLERADWPADLWLGHGGDHSVAEAEARNPFPAVSARLALFERRFGMPPQESLGWETFEKLAGQLQRRMEAASPEHAGGVVLEGLGRVEPPWLAARALLLELTGRRDDARALLLDEQDRWWWHCCPYDEAEQLYFLTSERALRLDRDGARDAALRWSLAAWFWGTVDELADDFGHHRTGIDWVLAHHAVLLAEAEEWDAVRTVLADLHTLRPDASGTHLVDELLTQRVPAPGEAYRELFSAQLGATDGRSPGGRLFAVGDPGAPSTWRLLGFTQRLWYPGALDRGPYARELRSLAPDDPRAEALRELPRPRLMRR